jgi:putative SOS response-associated peptidase YedK
VIVPPDQFDFWLDCRNVDEQMATEIIGPVPDGSMRVYEVSSAVNRVANDSSELIAPCSVSAAPPEKPKSVRKARLAADTGQGSLF